LLFSGDDAKKRVKVLPAAKQGRMLFGKLMLQRNNVLLMDEPTNHMDMESIESLNTALLEFKGTLMFVSMTRVRFFSGNAHHRDIRQGRDRLPWQL